MRSLGWTLVVLYAFCWIHGGVEVLRTHEDWALGEMALGVGLLLVGWLVLRRAHRAATDETWRERFGIGLAITALGSAALVFFVGDAVRAASGQMIMRTVLGGGAAVFGVLAALSIRAASSSRPID